MNNDEISHVFRGNLKVAPTALRSDIIMRNHTLRNVLAALASVVMLATAAHPAGAQSAAEDTKISLELNNLSPSDTGCLVTFMVRNSLDAALDQLAYEVVLFNGKGLVDRMIVLDFSPLVQGKTRVRQFDLDGISCPDVSRVLVNDAASCAGVDVVDGTCIRALETTTRTEVEFGS